MLIFKIAFIVGTLKTGGAEKQLYFILQALQKAEHKVQIYSLNQGGFYENKIKALGYPIIYVGDSTNQIKRLYRIVTLIKNFRPDFIQSTHFYANFYAALAGFFTRTTAIGAIRSNVDFEINGMPFLGPIILRMPKVLITNSEAGYQNLKKRFLPMQKHYLLKNVLDLETFDSSNYKPQTIINSNGKFVVITAARLNKVKRLDRFIEIIAGLSKTNPDVLGLILGDGPERNHLELLQKNFGISNENLRFLGMRTDISYLFSKASLFLLTSDHEGLPNAVIEAMAANLPVITTPAGDCSYIIKDGINGYVIDYDDTASMIDKIQHLIQNPLIREQIGKNNRQKIVEEYNSNRLGKNLMEIYNEIKKN